MKPRINFVRWFPTALILSGTLMVATLISLVVKGLSLGVDFAGGTMIHVKIKGDVKASQVREALAGTEFQRNLQEIQPPPGSPRDEKHFILRSRVQKQEKAEEALKKLKEKFGERVSLQRIELVGPAVGKSLRVKGLLAILISLAGILIYVGWRFEPLFAIGAIIALIHDSFLTLGFVSFTGIEFDITVLAAILTVIGYSINDTIVIYDRIRENLPRTKRGQLADTINTSINQTLSRTLMTSLTTLVVLIALLIFGGPVIKGFAAAMTFGVVVGTYSSIYIASPVILILKR